MATPIEARPARYLLIARTLHSLVNKQIGNQLRGTGSFPPGTVAGQCAAGGRDVRSTLAFLARTGG
jgi:hypothetical protein